VATSSAPHPERATQQGVASTWAQGLGKVFRRVALFRIDGTNANVLAVHGMGPPPLGLHVSLLDPTPLRWAIEAASPIVGAGCAPGGALVAQALGLSPPRAFAIIPLVVSGRLEALAYVDQGREPLPVAAAAELFSFTARILKGQAQTRPAPPAAERLSCRSTSSRPGGRVLRKLRLIAIPTDEGAAPEPIPTPAVPHPCRVTPPPLPADALAQPPMIVQGPPPAAKIQQPRVETPPPAPVVVEAPAAGVPNQPVTRVGTVDIVEVLAAPTDEVVAEARSDATVPNARAVAAVRLEARAPSRSRRWLKATLGVAATLLCLTAGSAIAVIVPLAPTGPATGDKTVQIPRNTSLSGIAGQLQTQGVIKNAVVFGWLARFTHSDRALKAGVYRLPTGAWAWAVLEELHHGQVHTRTITVPEGLTLTDVANLLEANGLARATDIIREANDPGFLAELGVPGLSLEGFLFPESYTLSLGLTAREILSVMHKEFKDRLQTIPGSGTISKDELLAKVTLASIVEREVRSKTELSRVAGVFMNRIDRDMRLESCATVQYLLGKPKKRLTLADVRIESPYNTYLNPGLPPGPISNPSLDSLKAVFSPEKHDYLFFFARPDGSHTHVFSRTYAQHQKAQKNLPHS
jgi:UPF0755 protein